MEEGIPISMLNDFYFCPYSVYLHNVYMEADESLYHATPQTRGKNSHDTIDQNTYSNKNNDLTGLSVYSEEYGLYGKIDLYKQWEEKLIERKYVLKRIFQGHIYQLWGEYVCLREMGYPITSLCFHEISTNTSIPVSLPDVSDLKNFKQYINTLRWSNMDITFELNPQKCQHCIYGNLCEKSACENVYQ